MQLFDTRKFKYWGHAEPPFSKSRIKILENLSKAILKSKDAKAYSDLVAFGFFCRSKNLHELLKKNKNEEFSIGIGTILHITPSNIPMNFALSFLFGFLSGNTNIIKTPLSKFPQVKIFVDLWKKISKDSPEIEKNIFIDFDRNDENLDYFTNSADGILAWGGDKTISSINNRPRKPSSIVWCFPDRYSISVINLATYVQLSVNLKKKLARNFFNDSLVVDQNACSSPSILYWYNPDCIDVTEAKISFWSHFLEENSDRFSLNAVQKIDRSIILGHIAFMKDVKVCNNFSDNFVRVELNHNNVDLDDVKPRLGIFFESVISKFDDITSANNRKLQTISQFGFDKNHIRSFILKNNLRGCDRVVDIGQALDFSLDWDGKNAIQQLTRKIF